jgi:maltose O-acetyltransferase
MQPLRPKGSTVDDDPTDDPAVDLRSHYERMRSGELYIADDPRIVEEQAWAHRLMEAYNQTPEAPVGERSRLLRALVGSVGEDVFVRPPFFCDFGRHLQIGDRTFVNFGLVALDVAPITIGADCQLGPNVQLLTPIHPLDPELRRDKWEQAAPITVADNVWLGGGVIVLPGVTIGADSVVGAGSVVSRDVPAGVVALGSPARVVRQL